MESQDCQNIIVTTGSDVFYTLFLRLLLLSHSKWRHCGTCVLMPLSRQADFDWASVLCLWQVQFSLSPLSFSLHNFSECAPRQRAFVSPKTQRAISATGKWGDFVLSGAFNSLSPSLLIYGVERGVPGTWPFVWSQVNSMSHCYRKKTKNIKLILPLYGHICICLYI